MRNPRLDDTRQRPECPATLPKTMDVDDYMFVPGVPYGDIILAQCNLRGFIVETDRSLQPGIFSSESDATRARKNLQLLRWYSAVAARSTLWAGTLAV